MKPNNIYLGDCLELMPQIVSGSIDMILCDLPYGTTACKWDTIINMDKLWEQYERIIKPNGAIVLTASQPFTSALVMSNPKIFKCEWIWHKSKASNFLQTSYMPLKVHESILIFSKSKAVYYPIKTEGKSYKTRNINPKHGNPNVYNEIPNYTGRKPKQMNGRFPVTIQYFSTAHMEGKFHPTQKPVALFEYLIRTYTKESELVLDNCIGSGTTAIACKNTKRNFIGIEKEEKYFNIAQNRINNYKPKLKLF